MEWKGGQVPPNWLDIVVDNFIVDADKVLALGGLPALPAMAVGSKANPIAGVVQRGRKDIFEKGAWIAVHNYTLNHPLDYPYDPVNQEGRPLTQAEYDALGPWAWEGASLQQINQWRAADKNPGDTLADDASCFLSFWHTDQIARQTLGFPVPLISTEGGPVVGWKEDRRYPRTTPEIHRDRVIEIAEFMQGTRKINGWSCPSNYFAMCHWLIANYRIGAMSPGWESQAWYTDWWNKDFNLQGELPTVAALKALPSVSVDEEPSAAIRGKVTRADTGEPLPGLIVQALVSGVEAAQDETGADGAFILSSLPAGSYDLAIAPWGIVRSGVRAVEDGGEPVNIALTGGKASALSGTVRTPADEPAANLEVLLRRDGRQVGKTQTAADGSFRFENLTLGNYRLVIPGITIDGIALDGWQTKSLKMTTGAAAGYKYAVTKSRLLPPEETNNRRVFYGVVSDASGAPVNGVKVRMSWEGAAAAANFPTAVTGSDPFKPKGYFEFLHTPGKFALAVVQGDWPSDAATGLDTANVPGREGQPVTYEVNFALQAVGSPAQVDGVINGGQAGRKVLLAPLAGGAARQASLAANGAFAFANVAPGKYRLSLDGVGVIADDIEMTPAALFRSLLALKSRLSGSVIGATEGAVAVLYAPPAWGWTRQTPLSAKGDYLFDNLPPGRYRLEVAGKTLNDLQLTGENRLQLAPIDLAGGRRSVIRGRVADGTGQPKADRAVTLKRETVVVGTTRTTADGAYRFANLPAGKYSVEVNGLGAVATNINLDGEREHVADVLWPTQAPRGVLQGRILNANGAPRPYVNVRLLKDGKEVARMDADAKGAFRFTSLPAGQYAVAVADGEPLARDIDVSDEATVVRDVTVPAAGPRVFEHYLLLAPPPAPADADYAEARLLLGLIAQYAQGDLVAGFSVDEAKLAERVTIVGDRIAAGAESALAAAGAQVTRLRGDGYAISAALAQLFAEG